MVQPPPQTLQATGDTDKDGSRAGNSAPALAQKKSKYCEWKEVRSVH